MVTGVKFCPLTSYRHRYDNRPPYVCFSFLTDTKRDYFGAHTFRVLPGKENERFKAGEDIRTSHHNILSPSLLIFNLECFSDVNWTGRGGNVSASAYNT